MMLLFLACTADPILLEPPGKDSGSPDDSGDSGDSGTIDTETTIPDDGPITDFVLSVDSDVVTVLHARWSVSGETAAKAEYRVGGGDWAEAPEVEEGHAVLFGFPEQTEVEARVVATLGGAEERSASGTITTGSLPRDVLVPEVSVYEAGAAYPADYAMVSVATGDYTYEGPYYVEILNRQGEIVWYHEVEDDLLSFYPSVSRDGTHLWYDADTIFSWGNETPKLTRMTLDGRWVQAFENEGMGQGVGEGPDGSFYYEHRSGNSFQLRQLTASGDQEVIWDCGAWMRSEGEAGEYCEMNATNWSPARNSVLTSMFLSDTVWEIDLESGEPVLQAGQFDAGEPWDFDPPDSVFDYQHWPNWLDNGHLLVSTHRRGVSGVQIAAEYEVDEENRRLTRVWDYTSTDLWATQVGEAVRLDNGNTIQGYGQDGAAREVTSDGDVVWEVTWPRDGQGDRVIGHLTLIPDLYALNVGG